MVGHTNNIQLSQVNCAQLPWCVSKDEAANYGSQGPGPKVGNRIAGKFLFPHHDVCWVPRHKLRLGAPELRRAACRSRF